LVAVLFFNVRLYSSSPLAPSGDDEPPALVAQLAANRSALEADSPTQMHELFPEGYYFSYLFHGLTWVELAMRDDSHAEHAIEEAIWCLSHLDSPAGRGPFPSNLPPDHGMFYSAWKCSLRAGVVVLQQGNDPNQLAQFRSECDAIARTIEQAENPFLASYDDAAWPCDTTPAIHALSAYDRITEESRYGGVIAAWLEDACERLDPETGLLPHTAELPDGRKISMARATSQVIMLRYLPDIDADLAKGQHSRFRERFLTRFVGAPCVLEYPSGVSGPGDVDSGPLIFGRSLSATVLMIGVAQIYGDQSLANAIAQSGETVGMPWTSQGQKRYVGGVMPIGDIIVAHAQVARPWFSKSEHHPDTKYRIGPQWRWQIHAVSMLVFLPTALAFFRRRRVVPAASSANPSDANPSDANPSDANPSDANPSDGNSSTSD
jgi:hypothetical protein